MPRFLDKVNLRQLAHHRMALWILRGPATQVAGDVLSGEDSKHYRNPRAHLLAEKHAENGYRNVSHGASAT
jgi:hypothetical protein